MKAQLKTISIKGFRSIKKLCDFQPRERNVLIGPNGVGKSNFISFFRLLSWMLTTHTGNLQEHVAALGGANAILHKGAARTRDVQVELVFDTESGRNAYGFWLGYAAGDTFIFTSERYRFSRFDFPSEAPWTELDVGHKEAQIIKKAEMGDDTARVIRNLMRTWVVYQFHNTSDTARIRQKWHEGDSGRLREDGANIAPLLLRLSDEAPAYYHRIVENLRLILPFFDDFDLTADRHGYTILRWRERDNDMVFSAPQAADGMLRCMALVTLLGLPEDDLPSVLILDEPELGLHPYAISIVAGLLQGVSNHVQVFVATQSTALVDHFEPEDIVVMDRIDGESRFSQLDSSELVEWMEEYSLSELWEKNVLGGRP